MIDSSDFIFLWGKSDKNISKKFIQTLGKKTFITGHPKYDLLKKENIKYFSKELIDIKNKHKKYVLISSNFMGGDMETDSNIYNKYYQNTFSNSQKKKISISKKAKDADFENYSKIIKIVTNLAKNNKKINFIFRPHPRQNLNKVRKRFPKDIKNLKVIYKYSITPWIQGSEVFIHSGCTTSFEAAILKKKIIYFVANDFPLRPKIYKKFGNFFKNLKKCENYINAIHNKKKKYNFKKLSKNIIENFDQKNFHDILFDILESKNISSSAKKTFSIDNFNNKNFKLLKDYSSKIKNYMLENDIGINLMNKIDPNLLLTKNYKKKKFIGIKKSEILKSLNLFRKINSVKKKYKIYDIRNGAYYLTTKKKIAQFVHK